MCLVPLDRMHARVVPPGSFAARPSLALLTSHGAHDGMRGRLRHSNGMQGRSAITKNRPSGGPQGLRPVNQETHPMIPTSSKWLASVLAAGLLAACGGGS